MVQSAENRRYLHAMGIDVWELKPRVAQIIEQPVEQATPVTAHDVAPGRSPVSAQEAAKSPETHNQGAIDTLNWDDLRTRVASCTACDLHKGRTQTVFGAGQVAADWMIIGQAPGTEEDRHGEPFVGQGGKLLNNMLQAIGLKREKVFITNSLKCHPAGNSDPQAENIASCMPYLQRQIALLQPKLILVVGRIAAQTLLACKTPLGDLRGQVHYYKGIALVVTYDPAHLLRNPQAKSKAWQDLLLARQACHSAKNSARLTTTTQTETS